MTHSKFIQPVGVERRAEAYIFFHNKDGDRQKSSTVNFANVYSVFHADILNSSAAWPCDDVQNVGDNNKSIGVCIVQCKGK